jgi:Uma2 family endonuclease
MKPMATVDDPRTAPMTPERRRNGKAGPRRWRWTAEQYRRLDKLGFFEDHHVELINGELIELTTNPPHDTAVGLTGHALRAAFGPEYAVREEKTLDLGRRYQPHPDVAVVVGSTRDYSTKHPTTAVLLVEACESSLRYDRVVKAHRYALAGIADYWIVNLIDRQLEIYRNPEPDPARPGRFRYADTTIVPEDGHARPLARPDAVIAVIDLLPRRG